MELIWANIATETLKLGQGMPFYGTLKRLIIVMIKNPK
jgi:hypothetical protein